MPFTFAHPAIILPLRHLPKKWFSLTGLVIGSLTPDFEYFLRMRIKSNYSHTIDGIFWFDLPLGILIAFLFHNLVRPQLFQNLPTALHARCSTFNQFNWNKHFKKYWPAVIFSIIIGAFSHIFWDSFTHDNGYFVQAIPFLQNSIEIVDKPIPMFKILQHASTLIGGLAIAWVIDKLPTKQTTRQTTKQNTSVKYWGTLSAMTLSIVAIRIFSGLDPKQYGNAIVTVISATMTALILTPILLRNSRSIS